MLGLFTVGATDYSNNILNDGSYDVWKIDITDEWTDARRRTHKNIVRTRIEGSFSMKFRNESSYQGFLAALSAVKDPEGFYVVGIKPGNGETQTINAYIDYRAVTEQDGAGRLVHTAPFTVSIEER